MYSYFQNIFCYFGLFNKNSKSIILNKDNEFVNKTKTSLRHKNFEEFLSEEILKVNEDKVEKEIALAEIASAVPQLAELGLSISDIVLSKGIIKIGFSESTAKELANGTFQLIKSKETGATMSIAIDTTTKKVVEHGKSVSGGLSNLANIATLVVGAAHLISGWDNSRKLKQINEKLDTILTDSKFEKIEKLEAIFELLKESQNFSDEDRRHCLLNLKIELKHLRNMWFGKLKRDLLKIKTPEQVKLMFWAKSSVRENGLREVTELEQFLILAMGTLAMEQLIAGEIGSIEAHFEITLPAVMEQLQVVDKLSSEVKLKLKNIKSKNKNDFVEHNTEIKKCLTFINRLKGQDELKNAA